MKRLATLLFLLVACVGQKSAHAGVTWNLAGSMTNFYCGGATDDTSSFNAALSTLYTNGGGTLFLKGTCNITGAVVFPNDSASSPTQPSIRITGAGSSANGYWGALPVSPSVLNLTYSAAVAKLDTRGAGLLEIDHITLSDSGSDCAAFIQTTNTTIYVHDVAFSGTHAAAAACNDAIVLGGTVLATDGSATAAFQGYHTWISHNTFDKVRKAVTVRAWANSVLITDNTYSLTSGNATRGTCGASACGGSAVEVQGAYSQLSGVVIRNNLFETLYLYNAIELQGANVYGNNVAGNSCWDGGTNFIGCVRFVNGACNNYVAGNYSYSDAYYPQTTSDVVNNCNRIDGASSLERNVIPGGLAAQSFGVQGTTFTLTGCSATALTGGATAGRFTSGVSGTCTVAITLGGQVATNAWSCWASNLTTPANVLRQTASEYRSTTFSGITVANDVVTFGCIGY